MQTCKPKPHHMNFEEICKFHVAHVFKFLTRASTSRAQRLLAARLPVTCTFAYDHRPLGYSTAVALAFPQSYHV